MHNQASDNVQLYASIQQATLLPACSVRLGLGIISGPPAEHTYGYTTAAQHSTDSTEQGAPVSTGRKCRTAAAAAPGCLPEAACMIACSCRCHHSCCQVHRYCCYYCCHWPWCHCCCCCCSMVHHPMHPSCWLLLPARGGAAALLPLGVAWGPGSAWTAPGHWQRLAVHSHRTGARVSCRVKGESACPTQIKPLPGLLAAADGKKMPPMGSSCMPAARCGSCGVLALQKFHDIAPSTMGPHIRINCPILNLNIESFGPCTWPIRKEEPQQSQPNLHTPPRH